MTRDKGQGNIQDKILTLATDMFIRHGYKGVSFLGIAKALGTTHSHIHYYFPTKAALAEAVVTAYVANTKADFRSIWTAEESDLLDRLVQSRDWIWRQYIRFNPGGAGGQNWGLLSRFASEADLLTPAIRKIIGTTLDDMDAYIGIGIRLAIERGELSREVSEHALVLQISSLLHTSRYITRLDGGFQRLDQLLQWTFDVTQRAYGTGAVNGSWPSELPPVVSLLSPDS